MKTIKITLLVSLIFCLNACVSSDIKKVIDQTIGATSTKSLTQTDIISGLKEALSKGASIGAATVSKTDGFLGNQLIKLAFPPEAQKLKSTLDSIGLSSLTKKVEISLNRAAEKASEKAAPIFLSAIKSMTIKDAMNILMGPQNAATDYLKKTTTLSLKSAFSPIIASSLNQVSATKYWSEATGHYNKILFVKPVTTDLNAYVTDKALDGLFTMIAKEELSIRQNPLERTTDLLKKVFGYAQVHQK